MSKIKEQIRQLSIIALVLSLIGLGIAGGPLGLIALIRSRKAGFGINPFALIALVIGVVSWVIFFSLLLTNTVSKTGKANDLERLNDIKALNMYAEAYAAKHQGYPLKLEENVLREFTYSNSDGSTVGFKPEVLVDPSNASITNISPVHDEAAAFAVHKPKKGAEYQYIPYDCTATSCKNYMLRTFIESPTSNNPNPYYRIGEGYSAQ